MDDFEAGMISLDVPSLFPRAAPHRCRRRMSTLLEWGMAAAMVAAVVVAADVATPRVGHQPGPPASIDPTSPHLRGSAPTIVTHPQAVAGEQITVSVAGAMLGTRRGDTCGVVYLRFDGRPVHHTVQHASSDPAEAHATTTATVIVPVDTAAGEHEVGIYVPISVPDVRSGADCAEDREHEAPIAVAPIIVVDPQRS